MSGSILGSDPAANVVDNLLAAARLSDTALPVELDLTSLQEARFAGDPVSELSKRLRAVQGGSEHDEAFVRLAGVLGPERVWETFCSLDAPSHAAQRLVLSGALPAGDSLARVVRSGSNDEVVATMVAASRRLRHQSLEVEPFTPAGLLALRAARDLPLGWVLTHIEGDLSDVELTMLGSQVEAALEADPTLLESLAKDVRPYHFPLLTAEQSEYLIERRAPFSERAAAVLLYRFGRTLDRSRDALTLDGALVCAAVNSFSLEARWESDLHRALRQAAKEGSDQLGLLPSPARLWVLENVLLAPDVLLTLLPGYVAPWLSGRFATKPTPDTVSLALDASLVEPSTVMSAVSGLVPAQDGFGCPGLPRQSAPTPVEVYLEECLRRVPGMARALLALAGEHPSDWTAAHLALVLPTLVEVLGPDERLWERFVTAAPNSPFQDPALTLPEAAARLRDRWAAAAARRSS